MKRKVIQLTAIPETTDTGGALIALCDDGTMFGCDVIEHRDNLNWILLKDVPQPEPNPEAESKGDYEPMLKTAVEHECVKLIKSGKRLEAIKYARSELPTDLCGGKAFVEDLEAGLKIK